MRLLIIVLILSAAAQADDDTMIRALLQRMQDAEPSVMKKLESFGYREHVQEERSGKPRTEEMFEVTYLKDRRIRRLIEKDGKPLSGAALEKENKRVEKLVTQLENGNAPPLGNRRLRLVDLGRVCQFSHVQRGKLQGREVVQCDFGPRPGFKPANTRERFVHGVDGKLWLDERALQIARAEFVLREAFKIGGGLFFNMKPGTRFTDEEMLYQGEVWLPKSREFVLSGKALIGVKVELRSIVAYSDYHRFDVSGSSRESWPQMNTDEHR